MNRRAAGIFLVAIAAFLWTAGSLMHALDPNFSDQMIATTLAVISLICGCIYLYLGEKDEHH